MTPWQTGDTITAERLNGMTPALFTQDPNITDGRGYLLFGGERVTYNIVKSLLNNGIIPVMLFTVADGTSETIECFQISRISNNGYDTHDRIYSYEVEFSDAGVFTAFDDNGNGDTPISMYIGETS